MKNAFFTNGSFNLGDEGKIDTNGLFKDSSELPKLIDKILDKYDDHTCIQAISIGILEILNV